jgi:hypothetical protein
MCVISIRNQALSTSVLELKFAKRSQSLPISHARESAHPEVFENPGFRVALAIASLPGMTLKLFNGFRKHHTRTSDWDVPVTAQKRGREPAFTIVVCDKSIRLTVQYCGSKKVAYAHAD